MERKNTIHFQLTVDFRRERSAFTCVGYSSNLYITQLKAKISLCLRDGTLIVFPHNIQVWTIFYTVENWPSSSKNNCQLKMHPIFLFLFCFDSCEKSHKLNSQKSLKFEIVAIDFNFLFFFSMLILDTNQGVTIKRF